jgi:hypothetical protein
MLQLIARRRSEGMSSRHDSHGDLGLPFLDFGDFGPG